jgi:hypothetical protein
MTDTTEWHLNKSVPVTIIFALLVQTAGIVIWATRLDSRVGSLETSQLEQNIRLNKLEESNQLLALIKDRQDHVLRTLDSNAKKLDELMQRK